ncbi:MAG TPA: M20/M25/M40 family metallo-hydrolase [Caulobacteraceae bacterium]|jgi:acetylornithine deacetylase/succinyl-diaminopimelate desuccinylase-like protein
MSDTRLGSDRRSVLKAGAASAAWLAGGGAALAAEELPRVREAIAAGHAASLKRLRDWIALPTIAAEGRNVREGAQYMAQLAREAGFQHVEIVPTSGVPGVFATLDAGAPKTLGLYFMYDVKQFDPKEWSAPPLESRLVDRPGFGKVLIGRGATNQKGPEATFLAALHAIRAAGRKLPVNLVLVAEGEEEIGSPHFAEVVRRPDVMAALKTCVGIMMPAHGQGPTGGVEITLGAKGMIELELVSSGKAWGRGPTKDVHSSLKAAVDSPVWRLVQALQTLVSADGNRITVDNWYENVRPLTAHQKALIAANVRENPEAETMRDLHVSHWIDDLPYQQAMERLASQPTINIEGLVAGYTGPGGKTILPSRAVAKLDCRLVPNQTRAEAVAKLKRYLAKKGFADIEVNVSGGYDPTETDENSGIIKAEVATYTALGRPPTMIPRLAGSWPGYLFTGAPLNLPAGHFGMGYGTGAHAPDELMLVESTNRALFGMDEAALAYVRFLHRVADIA